MIIFNSIYIKGKIIKLWESMCQKTIDAEKHLTNLGWFIIITFPVFYIVNIYIIGIKEYENLFLRTSIGFLGAILVMRKYLPAKLTNLIPFILYISLLYAFPFFFFFMLFNNADSHIWKINVLSGLFFLSFFLSWKEYVVFSVLGFLLAWVTFSLTSPNTGLPSDIIGLIITYANPVIYLAIFSNRKDLFSQEKLNTMKMLAGSIAHELRTPLSAMMMDVQYLATYFPYYQDAYAKAKEAKLPVHKMSREEEADLIAIPTELQTISQNANTMITMLLTNLHEGRADRRVEACSMKLCVEEALKTYPFSPSEKRLIHWQDGKAEADFLFLGHKEIMKHVLYNLLKNALYAIASKRKGEIYITLEPAKPNGKKSKSMNKLIFKDTGPGIPPDILRHIFNRFYTKTEHGTGIGLAFCQTVIQSFGGNITCASQEGVHTVFTISLPFIEDSRAA